MKLGQEPITYIDAPAAATAKEAVTDVEISVVVDISGSMGSNGRITKLRDAASEFYDTVLQNTSDEALTTVNFVAYNHTVTAGASLLDRMNADGSTVGIDYSSGDPYPELSVLDGRMASYQTEHDLSNCVLWNDADMSSTAISPTTPLERIAHFDYGSDSYTTPETWDRWCDDDRNSIVVHETDPEVLKDIINDTNYTYASGWTAIENGLKWGAALLDPAFRPVVNDMINDGEIDARAIDRPAEFAANQADHEETLKVIVLMTDGANTTQRDMKPAYKNGLTDIWYSHDLGGTDPGDDKDRDGYLVFVPWRADNGWAPWYRPGESTSSWDDEYYYTWELPYLFGDWANANSLPYHTHGGWQYSNHTHGGTEAQGNDHGPDDAFEDVDLVQQDWIEIWDRWAVNDAAYFFYRHVWYSQYETIRNSDMVTEDANSSDTRLRNLCDTTKANDVLIFSIGFEAPSRGQTVMRYCASDESYYFDVNGTEISTAFSIIASQISNLKLTQ